MEMSRRKTLSGRRILVVESTQALPLALRGATGAQVTIARFLVITQKMLTDLRPDIVVAPLIADDHDILDIAQMLTKAQFTGALRAFCNPLPNTAIICAEVAAINPLLDFEVIEMSGSGLAPPL